MTWTLKDVDYFLITVWRIKNFETGTFFFGVHPTRMQAVKSMPKLINSFFVRYALDMDLIWYTMSRAETVETGVYYNKAYDLLFAVTSYEICVPYPEDGWQPVVSPGWCDDKESLQDNIVYDIMLWDGSVLESTRFNEELGIFSYKEEDIWLDDVKSFKEH